MPNHSAYFTYRLSKKGGNCTPHNYRWARLDRQERKVKNGVGPQFSSTQFVVTKDVMRGRTYSSLREVTAKARREEIARMLGGKSDSALKLAASLLNESS